MEHLLRQFSRYVMPRLKTRGIDILRDPRTNKGTAYTLRERQLLGIHGLLPPGTLTQEDQVQRVINNVYLLDDDLKRYIFLSALQDRNEKLFYKVVTDHLEYCLPIVYTPTVGVACQKYGILFRRPRGLYITIHDKGHIDAILGNWPEPGIKAITVTDGERILGLGDLGAYGMGIPVGKLSLYTALGGINPEHCLPVLIDVGTSNEKLLKDPKYIGVRHDRVRGKEYDELIDEFMEAATNRYGPNTCIQFEDFANTNAFRLLERYRHQYCTFNDDIQGTAAVSLAGFYTSTHITGTKLSENRYLFYGAGEASIGIAKLLIRAMQEEGVSLEQAHSRIYMMDSKGLLTKDRPDNLLSKQKLEFAKDMTPIDTLDEAVRTIRPTALIGAAAVPGVFTRTILRDMSTWNKRPIIFALSTPTALAECTPDQAYRATEGRCVFVSGSPFPNLRLPNGRELHPSQGSNYYVFPGVALAVTSAGIRPITDDLFLEAAKILSTLVTPEDIEGGRVYPPLSKTRCIAFELAVRLLEYAYKAGTASYFPEPADKRAFLKTRVYSMDYDEFVPEPYEWPEGVGIVNE